MFSVHHLHPCHPDSTEHNFSSFSFHSFLASLENLSILSCSVYGHASLFLTILVSCFVVFIFYSRGLSLIKFLCSSSQCLLFTITVNIFILLASFVTLLLTLFFRLHTSVLNTWPVSKRRNPRTYSRLYFMSYVNIWTTPLILHRFTFF